SFSPEISSRTSWPRERNTLRALCPRAWAALELPPEVTRANLARRRHPRPASPWHRRCNLLAHAPHREHTRQAGSAHFTARTRGPDLPGVLTRRHTSANRCRRLAGGAGRDERLGSRVPPAARCGRGFSGRGVRERSC